MTATLPPLMTRSLAIGLLVLVLALAGCGGGDDNSSDESTATPEAAATETATPAAAPTTEAKKPAIKVPKGKPPKKLIIKDLKEGDGPRGQARGHRHRPVRRGQLSTAASSSTRRGTVASRSASRSAPAR